MNDAEIIKAYHTDKLQNQLDDMYKNKAFLKKYELLLVKELGKPIYDIVVKASTTFVYKAINELQAIQYPDISGDVYDTQMKLNFDKVECDEQINDIIESKYRQNL